MRRPLCSSPSAWGSSACAPHTPRTARRPAEGRGRRPRPRGGAAAGPAGARPGSPLPSPPAPAAAQIRFPHSPSVPPRTAARSACGPRFPVRPRAARGCRPGPPPAVGVAPRACCSSPTGASWGPVGRTVPASPVPRCARTGARPRRTWATPPIQLPLRRGFRGATRMRSAPRPPLVAPRRTAGERPSRGVRKLRGEAAWGGLIKCYVGWVVVR
jgi:hypothetical protein